MPTPVMTIPAGGAVRFWSALMKSPKSTVWMSQGTWRLATVGMELAAAVGGGCLLGYWVDREFGTDPWGLVIGAVLGIVGGLYNLVRKAVRESLRISEAARGGRSKLRTEGDDRRDGSSLSG